MSGRAILQAPGHPIAYFPSLARHVGGVDAAVLLCQSLYWTPRTKNQEGWFYKCQADLCAETGLTMKEQQHARTELKTRQLLDEWHDRLNHRLYLRVRLAEYNRLILLISNQMPKEDFGKCQKGISGNTETAFREMPKGDFAKDFSETTTETTAEITGVPPGSAVGPVGPPSETSPAPETPGSLRRRPMPMPIEATNRTKRRRFIPTTPTVAIVSGPTWKRTWKAAKVFPDDFPQAPPEWFLAWALAEVPDVDVRLQWKRMLTQEYKDKKTQFFLCAQRWMLTEQGDPRRPGRSGSQLQGGGHGRLYSDVTAENLATRELFLRRGGVSNGGS
jgi:hypothetical protein